MSHADLHQWILMGLIVGIHLRMALDRARSKRAEKAAEAARA